MVWARRILSVCMALAFAGFGAVTAASAHSHASGEEHGFALHGLALADHHADHHASASDAHHHDAEDPADQDDGTVPDQGSVFHVHAVAHYAPVDDRLPLVRHLTVATIRWSQPHYERVTLAAAPPLRPPRTLL